LNEKTVIDEVLAEIFPMAVGDVENAWADYEIDNQNTLSSFFTNLSRFDTTDDIASEVLSMLKAGDAPLLEQSIQLIIAELIESA